MEKISSIIDEIKNDMDVISTHIANPKFKEVYLTKKEVIRHYHIAERTLQLYRDNGTLPFTTFGGKILYRQSDIETILNNNYRPKLKPIP